MVRLRVLFGVMLGAGLMGLGLGYEMGQQSRTAVSEGPVAAPVCSMANGPDASGDNTSPISSPCRTIHLSTFTVDGAPECLAERINLELTEEVVRAIVMKTPYKVVNSKDADSEMTGIVKSFHQQEPPGGLNPGSDLRSIETHLVIQLTWKDLRTGGSLLPPKDGRRPATIELQSVAYYAPELGQSIEQPRQENVQQMTQRIIDLMETSW